MSSACIIYALERVLTEYDCAHFCPRIEWIGSEHVHTALALLEQKPQIFFHPSSM